MSKDQRKADAVVEAMSGQFYSYYQNNSGGHNEVRPESGIGKIVFIQAPNVMVANERARAIGLYWDGVLTGRDCECCGDRWSPAVEGDACDRPGLQGYENWVHPAECFVHYANGRFESL